MEGDLKTMMPPVMRRLMKPLMLLWSFARGLQSLKEKVEAA